MIEELNRLKKESLESGDLNKVSDIGAMIEELKCHQ